MFSGAYIYPEFDGYIADDCDIRGGVFFGGHFTNVAIRSGSFYGGVFEGRQYTFTGGSYGEGWLPLYIVGSVGEVNIYSLDKLCIQGVVESFNWWHENLSLRLKYATTSTVEEYREYVKLAERIRNRALH